MGVQPRTDSPAASIEPSLAQQPHLPERAATAASCPGADIRSVVRQQSFCAAARPTHGCPALVGKSGQVLDRITRGVRPGQNHQLQPRGFWRSRHRRATVILRQPARFAFMRTCTAATFALKELNDKASRSSPARQQTIAPISTWTLGNPLVPRALRHLPLPRCRD
jgi:hypothetical protein